MIWYANIDVSASGNPLTSGNGTEDSPLSWDALLQLLDVNKGIIGPSGQISAISDYDTVMMRGYYFESADVIFVSQDINQFSATGVTFKSWDLSKYGYWKISSEYGMVYLFPNHEFGWGRTVSANFEDFVVENVGVGNNDKMTNIFDLFLNFYNGIFYGDTTFRIANENYPFKFLGCTFVDGTFFASDSYYGSSLNTIGLSAIFEDCVFINETFELSQDGVPDQHLLSGDYIFEDCVFNSTSATTFNSRFDNLIFRRVNFDWTCLKYFPNISDLNIENKNNLNFLDYNLDYNLVSGRRKNWITNNYNFGAYGKSRKGPGAFYFNDDIYVDLNSETDGTGSSFSPMTSAQFNNYINSYDSTIPIIPQTSGIYTDDCLYIKGTLETNVFNFTHSVGISNNNANFNSNYYLKAWNPIINGPFRVYATSEINLGQDFSCVKPDTIIIENAIFYSPVININESLSSDTVFYKADLYNIDYIPSLDFNGCTIITSANFDASSPLTIKDSIFTGKLYSSYINSHPIVINTVLTVSADSVLNGINVNAITSGNQYGWVEPVWPNYNSQLSAFSYSNLGKNITISGSGEWNDI